MVAIVVDRRRGAGGAVRVGRHRTAVGGRRLGDHHRPQRGRHRQRRKLLPLVGRSGIAVRVQPAAARPADRDQHRAVVAEAAEHRARGGHMVRALTWSTRQRGTGAGDSTGADSRRGVPARRVAALQSRHTPGSLCGAWCYRCAGVGSAGDQSRRAWPAGARRRIDHPDQPQRPVGRRPDTGVCATAAGRPRRDRTDTTSGDRRRGVAVLRCSHWPYRRLRRPDLGRRGHRD